MGQFGSRSAIPRITLFFLSPGNPREGLPSKGSRTLFMMQQNPSIDRGQVIFMGGLISAVLATVLLMLAYVPL